MKLSRTGGGKCLGRLERNRTTRKLRQKRELKVKVAEGPIRKVVPEIEKLSSHLNFAGAAESFES